MAQAPKLTLETSKPVRPSALYCTDGTELLFVAVEVEFLDHPGLPAFLLRDGDAQVPGFNRRGEVEPGVGFANRRRRDHGPRLAVIGRLDAVGQCSAEVLTAFALLTARIDVDANDVAARGQLDGQPLHGERFEALGEISRFWI